MVFQTSIVTSVISIILGIFYVLSFSGTVFGNESGDVRLVGGSKPNEGRVEIHNEGVWGTYCGDSIDVQIGMVICRQAGYPGAAMRFQTSQEFGSGTGPVYYNGYMSCVGIERSLSQCHFINYKYNKCTHEKDAGVICQEPGYLGCYPADGSNFQSIVSLTSSGGTDSVDECLTLCKSGNMSIAAISGKSCQCSHQLPSNISSSKVTDDKCSITCPGNSRQICGGPEYYSVFSTTDGFCDPLNPPVNGTVDTTFTRYGTTVNFGCSRGFELEGAKKTQCVRSETHTSGFKWNKVVPFCTVRRNVNTLNVLIPINVSTGLSGLSNKTGLTSIPMLSDVYESTPVPPAPSSGSNTGIVVGVISGLLLVAIVMTLAFIFCRTRRPDKPRYERKPVHVRSSWTPLHIRTSWTPTHLQKGELNAEPHMYETTSQGGTSLYSTPIHRARSPGSMSEHEYASYHEYQHDLSIEEDITLLHSPTEKMPSGCLTLKHDDDCCDMGHSSIMVVNELYNPSIKQMSSNRSIYEITEDDFQLLRESHMLDNRAKPELPQRTSQDRIINPEERARESLLENRPELFRRTSRDPVISPEEHIYEPEPLSELSFAMEKEHVYSSADYAYAEVDPRDSGLGTLGAGMVLRGSLPCFQEEMVVNELYISSDNVNIEQQTSGEEDSTVMVENILYHPHT